MKVLVDSSVWVEILKNANSPLKAELIQIRDSVATHEMIIGEMALNNRGDTKTVEELKLIDRLPTASIEDYLVFVQENSVGGRGVGYVDTNLLLSCIEGNARIWTLDAKLQAVARELSCLY